jgi:hypothetical protein
MADPADGIAAQIRGIEQGHGKPIAVWIELLARNAGQPGADSLAAAVDALWRPRPGSTPCSHRVCVSSPADVDPPQPDPSERRSKPREPG